MVLFKASFIHLLVLRPWPTLWPTGGQIFKKINTTLRVANGARKIQGLDKFCSNLEISEAFSMSLEIWFSQCVSLGLGFSNFWLRGLRVSDFVFWSTVSIKTMRKLFI